MSLLCQTCCFKIARNQLLRKQCFLNTRGLLTFTTHQSADTTHKNCLVNLKSFKVSNNRLLRLSTKPRPLGASYSQTTVDDEEVKRFSLLSEIWWDEGGEFEALHTMNELRIPLIRDGLLQRRSSPSATPNETQPLAGFKILDVGCGGGILSEPLGRLGATVCGLEASEETIKIAQTHLNNDPALVERVTYTQSTIESLLEEDSESFDAVVASEVVEHVADVATFVDSCCKLLKPEGSLFLTTLNKTFLSYALGIVAAERLLNLVPAGTHDWNKFVDPSDLQYMLDQNGLSIRLLHGMSYNVLTKRWSWIKDTRINYAIHAVNVGTATRD